ncbi:MAG: RluA family pseudouridine synthase [Candidatus Limisoma sp.]|nr:RluA family pseudouridine synthase [Muribaculaceae bacterium]MDD6868945.1 RluA family pseudouridine synthase [bacterium]MDY5826905.1 RluA family pseudouridine synthase [Candidatus Limisoma sp.]
MTRTTKPGAERRRWRPDSIFIWRNEEETTLLQCLEQKLSDHKRSSLKAMMKYGQVAVNGVPTSQFDVTVQPGDEMSVNFTRPFVTFSHPRIRLVYEDDDIIVVHKGSGILSVGTDNRSDGTAYSIVRNYLKNKDPHLKLFIIHRLDRDTSGLMMFAKNIEAKEAMQHNWNNMVLSRTYVAVVEGKVEEESGTVRSYLAETSQYEVYSTQNPEEGQLAITRYKRLDCRHGYSLMELSLDTGRKNQIRVHMKDLGHPIVGDRKYGAKSSPLRRMALHARTLRFVHPVTRKDMLFETPIPSRFLSLLK